MTSLVPVHLRRASHLLSNLRALHYFFTHTHTHTHQQTPRRVHFTSVTHRLPSYAAALTLGHCRCEFTAPTHPHTHPHNWGHADT